MQNEIKDFINSKEVKAAVDTAGNILHHTVDLAGKTLYYFCKAVSNIVKSVTK